MQRKFITTSGLVPSPSKMVPLERWQNEKKRKGDEGHKTNKVLTSMLMK